MAIAYSILGQSAPSTTTATDLFTVVTAHSYVVATLVIANTTSTYATATVYARKSGAAAATTNAIAYNVQIPGNSTVPFTLGITLNGTNGDTLTVQTGTANALTFTAFGSDNS